MRRIFALLFLLAVALSPATVFCGDHLVSPAVSQEQLARAATERAEDVASIERVLSSPRAVSAAGSLGVSLDRVRAAVPSLSDQELRDLAARASLVHADPVAGVSEDVNDLLVVLLVVAIVVVVLSAVS
jgi:hypothetical protein